MGGIHVGLVGQCLGELVRRGVLARAGFAVVATGLQQCLSDEKSDVDLAKMEKLFLALA